MNNTETSIKTAFFFVLGYGKDCDGCESFSLTSSSTKKLAEEHLESSIDGSDGVRYIMTSNMETVAEYCRDWDRDPKDYTNAYE